MRIVNVAGYTNSGEDHWQTHLEKQYRDFSRVQQDDWSLVERDPWLDRLTEHIQASKEDTVLVCHSCGSIASVQWLAQRYDPRVKAAILVAPADVESPNAPAAIRTQGMIPEVRLPVPTALMASTNDPFMATERSQHFADLWGSELLWAGNAGHISSDDGYGYWRDVVALIERYSGSELHPR